MDRYEEALKPFTQGRGIDWEVQVNDADVRNYTYPWLPLKFLTSSKIPIAHPLEREWHGPAAAGY
jgi:hypothetical protein